MIAICPLGYPLKSSFVSEFSLTDALPLFVYLYGSRSCLVFDISDRPQDFSSWILRSYLSSKSIDRTISRLLNQ